jgi:hypothetical protein
MLNCAHCISTDSRGFALGDVVPAQCPMWILLRGSLVGSMVHWAVALHVVDSVMAYHR